MAIELLRVIALGLPDDYTPLTPRSEFDNAWAATRAGPVPPGTAGTYATGASELCL